MITEPVDRPYNAWGIREEEGAKQTTEANPRAAPKTPSPPSPRQMETLQFLRRYKDLHGIMPARSEIAKALGCKHRSTADVHVTALMKKGWLELQPGQTRYIRLLHEDLPIVRTGAIQSDEHVRAQGRVIDTMPPSVAKRFEPSPDWFVEVGDDTMCNVGLVAGDIVAVRTIEKDEIPKTGAIVVARRKDEITIRRLRHIDERHIELSPETSNATHREQMVDLERDDVRIEGVMVGALIMGDRPAIASTARAIEAEKIHET